MSTTYRPDIALDTHLILNGYAIYESTKENKIKSHPEKGWLRYAYFLDVSRDTFRNSFRSFSRFREDFRARVPAALLPLSNCAVASALKDSISFWILFNRSFIIFYFGIITFTALILLPTGVHLNHLFFLLSMLYQNMMGLIHLVILYIH